ncbi:MAG: hypothetical protein ACJAXJ_004298, partial [Colwellia sp.]
KKSDLVGRFSFNYQVNKIITKNRLITCYKLIA